ncbi:MAG: FG-GAP-like repeat-containing protein [Thermoplasmata archaeon]
MLPRRPLDHRGVSEVIGTILILLITVVIFSTIVLWVFTLPAPRAAGNAGIDGGLEGRYVAGSWAGAYVNLTHLGGDDLLDPNTRVYLTIDGTTHTLKTQGSHFDGVSVKPYGVDGPDVHWNIGETWTYENETIPITAEVGVLVADVVRGTVVWDQILLGEGGEHLPVFLEKWFDSEPSTLSRDPVAVDDTFAIYARVGDPDGDLNPASVWGYLTFGFGGPLGYVQLLDNGDPNIGDALAGDGVFSRSLSFAAMLSWDGGIIILNATDQGGREAQTRLTLRVVDTGSIPDPAGPVALTFASSVQRFDIYEESDWNANRWNATSTRTFVKGQTVVVVVASQTLRDLDFKNDFFMHDPSVVPLTPLVYSDPPYNEPVGETTTPSSTKAFSFVEFVGDYYVYEHRFSTTSADAGFDGVQLAYGQYPLTIELKSSIAGPPLNRFATTDTITVTDDAGGSPDYPRLTFYKDAGYTQQATSFNYTDVMYVKVTVRETDLSVSAGDVFVSDYFGGVQIWATPGVDPIGPLSILDIRNYTFSVDLSNNNADAWLPGINSYGFRIKEIRDGNEVYALAAQVTVQGPRWKLDVVTANEEFGHPIFDQKWYALFFENIPPWAVYLIEYHQSTPMDPDPPWGRGPFHDITLADMDEDGDLDAVTAAEVAPLFWYRNLDGAGNFWQRIQIDDQGVALWTVDAGRIDRDTDNDVVTGNVLGQIYAYYNTGVWSRTLVADLGSEVVEIKLADVTGDGFNDIVAGMKSGFLRIYENDGLGDFPTSQAFGVGAEIKDLTVADVDGDGHNDIVLARGSDAIVAYGPGWGSSARLSAGSLVLAVDVGHIDGDETLDVVTGNELGFVHWFANDGSWDRTAINQVPSADKVYTLRVGDIDGDFWDDVLVGTETGDILWYRHDKGISWSTQWIADLGKNINSLDIGDVDRGIAIRRSEPP